MAKEGVLIRGRFKVIQELRNERGFSAVLAVDILEREQPLRLLNVYNGMAVRQVVPAFQSLKNCPEYVTYMLDGDSLITVFRYVEGEPIDRLFHEKANIDWSIRLLYADQLFHLGLTVSDYPPEIGCGAFYSENLLVRPADEKLAVCYVLPAKEGLDKKKLMSLLIEQANKILPERWNAVPAEKEFMERLNAGEWKDPVRLYAAWREVMPQIEKENSSIVKTGMITQVKQLLLSKVKRKKGKGTI